MPYGTVGPDSWSHMHRTPIKHISGCEYSQPKRKTNGTKHTFRHHFTSVCSPLRRAHRSNYQHMPTAWWLEVMQMQLASICIRQQLTDAQMADNRDAPAIFGRGKDWRPFCLKLCPSGWKQPHCITVTTAAVWELWGHTAAARCQAHTVQSYTQTELFGKWTDRE